ncbi:NADH-quinone oxidoreductase subunit N [Marmoricola endophyticus]|uniref:NADH-quinone oxidoreductase subunit N n=1 Tax=Marmoricola endophyticus TaxID=2040280 RepID=A0A917BPA2_9ACTN|nr:NADH-quinone oxidoreductase subunit NuoN [Marmoricola endophyticus]GGF51044.1 NADH-quinone oxidoreductase subunit N [Marmoricola endophyticus]
MTSFDAPKIEYFLLAPVLIVLGAAVVGVLLEAALPRGRRYLWQALVAGVGLIAALVQLVLVCRRLDLFGGGDAGKGRLVAEQSLALDGPTVVIWALVLVFALLGVLLFAERHLEGGVLSFAGQAAALPGTEAEREASSKGLEHTEVFPLLMFAVAGMLIFPAANDLVTMFVGLEVLSLPLYLLCGLARRRRLLSQEAAMKYFLLGAFSSGFFVYGLALVYGYAGSMRFAEISAAVSGRTTGTGLLLGGIGLMSVGLLFKVGAAPFHSWTPDVYQGAPTAVTGFMAAATKVAAFGALLRLFYVAFGGARWDWVPVFAGIAVLTMVIGSVVAVTQNDVKRLLAYSSVAHAGFLLVGVLGIRSIGALQNGELGAVQAVLFYLVTYGFTTMAAFAIVTLVRDSGGEVSNLERWAGLGQKSPLVAGVFAFLLLALAGIPLTSGFTGKWAVFTAAVSAGWWPVVVVAVLLSAVAAYFYVRVIRLMFFTAPLPDGPSVAVPSVLTMVVIAVGTLATLLLGLVPGYLLDRIGDLSLFVR